MCVRLFVVCQSTLESFVSAQAFFSYEEVLRAQERAATAQRRFIIGIVALTLVVAIWIFFRLRPDPAQRAAAGAGDVPGHSRVRALLFRASGNICILLGLGGALAYYAGVLDVAISYPFFALIALGTLGQYLKQQGDRYATAAADDVMRNDPRAPIAYLRTFGDDETRVAPYSLVGFPQSESTFEEAILEGVREYGPVVALQNPSLVVRPSAYAPLRADDAGWRDEASRLIRTAAMIVVVVNRGEGLAWEIQELRAAERLRDTVFFFVRQPGGDDSLTWLMERLGFLADTTCEVVDVNSPGEMLALRVAPSPTIYKAEFGVGGYALTAERVTKDIFMGVGLGM